jgi:hypothetical protein
LTEKSGTTAAISPVTVEPESAPANSANCLLTVS